MPEANRDEGDPQLRELFERFDGWLVSPAGAAALLGSSRKTIYTLGKRETLRVLLPDRRQRPDLLSAAAGKPIRRAFPPQPPGRSTSTGHRFSPR